MKFPIVLKDNEELKGQVFSNCEFDRLIVVKGDNVVIEDVFVSSPKKEFKTVIQVKGKNCVIRNCRFQNFSVDGCVILLEKETVVENCLFYGSTSMDNNHDLVGILSSKTTKNIVYNNRFENWERGDNICLVNGSNNVLVNNEVVNSRGCFNLCGENNLVAYNFFDGKDRKVAGGIKETKENENMVLGNIYRNLPDYKDVDYPLIVNKFDLRPFDELKHMILEYKQEEKPKPKEPTPEPVMPDMTVKEFMNKLTKRLHVLDRIHKLKDIQQKMDNNLKEFRELLAEHRDMIKE